MSPLGHTDLGPGTGFGPGVQRSMEGLQKDPRCGPSAAPQGRRAPGIWGGGHWTCSWAGRASSAGRDVNAVAPVWSAGPPACGADGPRSPWKHDFGASAVGQLSWLRRGCGFLLRAKASRASRCHPSAPTSWPSSRTSPAGPRCTSASASCWAAARSRGEPLLVGLCSLGSLRPRPVPTALRVQGTHTAQVWASGFKGMGQEGSLGVQSSPGLCHGCLTLPIRVGA